MRNRLVLSPRLGRLALKLHRLWLRLGSVALQQSAAFCTLCPANHLKIWLFRVLGASLNLLVVVAQPNTNRIGCCLPPYDDARECSPWYRRVRALRQAARQAHN